MIYRNVIKRVLDFVFCILFIPVFFIAYILVGIAIKIDDGGPVLYSGKRIGKDFAEFKMFKFRSMITNAPDIRNDDGSTYNSEKDQRLTRTGRIIRRLSIDEIPQVINIIKGDMTLIGPRPSPVGNIKRYSEEYKRKFTLKPGITGYTQAYLRNAYSLSQKEKSDIYYVDNISLKLDMMILLKTIKQVIMQRGIYTNKLDS